MVDPIIATFLEESCRCFTNGCYKAAAVMCGVASERLIHLFATSLFQSISNPSHGQAIKLGQALRNPWQSSTLEAAIRAILSNSQSVAGWPLTMSELQRFILPTFAWIKVNRDSSGHPSDFQITHIEMRGQLIMFVTYLEKIYRLINFLSGSKVGLV
jgi:hypothetical protein